MFENDLSHFEFLSHFERGLWMSPKSLLIYGSRLQTKESSDIIVQVKRRCVGGAVTKTHLHCPHRACQFCEFMVDNSPFLCQCQN